MEYSLHAERRIAVVPFATRITGKGAASDAQGGMLARMVALTISEKLRICHELDSRFFPLFASVGDDEKTWAVPARAWREQDALRLRTRGFDPDVVVYGHFAALRQYELMVTAFDIRGRFTRFRKVIRGDVDSFLDHFETLILEMVDSLGVERQDANLRHDLTRFGTRDWRAWRAFLAGRSNQISCALNVRLPEKTRVFGPFVEAFTRDRTFQEAAEQLAMFSLEIVLGDKGTAGAAVRALQKAVQAFPECFKLQGALGFCYRKLDYRQDAQLAWERCLELDTERLSSAETLFQLGCLLEEARDFPAARDRYEAALCHQHDHCDAHDRLAFVLANLGDLDGAIEHWQTAIRLDPDRQAIYGHLGWAFQEKGDADLAKENYEKGVTDSPAAWNVYFHYATFLVRNDHPEHALAVLEKARCELGEFAWIHERMGAAYLVLGDGQRAQHHLRAAVKMDPDGDFGKSAALALTQIQRIGRSLSSVIARVAGLFGRLRPRP